MQRSQNWTVVRSMAGRARLSTKQTIQVRVGKVICKFTMFCQAMLDIADVRFNFDIDQDSVTTEAALDGLIAICSRIN